MRYMSQMRLVCLVLLLSIGRCALADVGSVRAIVDKNPAMADESITLTVTADDSVERDAFDPSVLLSDFVVGRTNISSKTQMVNFKTSRSTVWTTTLIPRKPGQFRIPAFTIEGVSSQPIDLLIVPASNTRPGGRDLFVTTAVDHERVYLQQQLKYTVRLHLARDLQRGSLSAPTLENADIRQIGKDKEISEIIDGVRYRIIERVFAVTPQRSGSFTISGPLFEGEVVEGGSQQGFGFFNRTKSVSRVGPSISVEVLPIPSQTNHHWLPSEYVQLNEEWQPANGDYRVGEPITRTLTLTAVGVVEEQLPDIGSQYPDSVKTYPDQANSATVDREDTLVAQRTESVAIIPGESGSLTIPEVRVPWFNIVTQQTEFATLPARTIEVQAALASLQPGIPAVQTLPAPEQETSNEEQPSLVPTTSVTTHWWSLSSWILLVLWLMTLALWFWERSRGGNGATVQKTPDAGSEGEAYQLLEKRLKTSQPEAIRPALTNWLALLCGNASLPLPVSQQLLGDSELDREVSQMFASVYGSEQNTWRSDRLTLTVASLRRKTLAGKTNNQALKSLYPA